MVTTMMVSINVCVMETRAWRAGCCVLAATGGFVGSGIMLAIQFGVARGIVSNESGMGSAAIAAAAAKTQHPARQALVSMTQTFIDTIIVVTITGLVIVTAGTWDMGREEAAIMTASAFGQALPGEWGSLIVSVALIFFAFSTILGWSYYGERAIVALFGDWASIPYRMFFTALSFVGAVASLELAWTFSDLSNGLMAIPNLIGLLLLSGIVVRETREYPADGLAIDSQPWTHSGQHSRLGSGRALGPSSGTLLCSMAPHPAPPRRSR